MEKNLDERMSDIAARIEETRRIRRGLYAHLGERIFNQVVADPDLRNGKEEILGAIAACNRELSRLEDASASLDARMFAASKVGEAAVAPVVASAPSVTETVAEPTGETVVAAVDAPVAEEPVGDVAGASVVVAPLEPLSPAAAPDPVTLEPVALDAAFGAETGKVGAAATDTAPESSGDDWASFPPATVQGVPSVLEDAADGAAPTIVLDRGGEGHGGSESREPEAVSDEAGSRRVCPVCGAAVAPDHRFCMNCGYRLDD